MGRPRLQLQQLLLGLCENVYFQPPSNIELKFPCIVYQRDDASLQHADNEVFRHLQRYQVSWIDLDPDSVPTGQLLALPHCSYSRFYVADNLNHDVFNLFY
jgi:hypothetical protein